MHGVIVCMHSNTVYAHGPLQCHALLLTTLAAVGDMAAYLRPQITACWLAWTALQLGQGCRCTVCMDCACMHSPSDPIRSKCNCRKRTFASLSLVHCYGCMGCVPVGLLPVNAVVMTIGLQQSPGGQIRVWRSRCHRCSLCLFALAG